MVYNDGQSGVFVSSGRTWKLKFNVFDSEASKDNGDYGSISFMIPQVETQTTTYVDDKGNTVTYVDDKGNTVSIDPIVQKGLNGQSYTTQGGKVIKGYFAKEPSNASGYMSPFGKQGATYVKDLHNGYKATFKETNTATGEMLVTVTDKYGVVVDQFNLKSGDTHYVEEANWNIHSIYIPQTINIQYVYEKLGNLIIDSDSKAFPAEDKTTTPYPNDENDSTKAGNVKIPEVPGFTPTINGKTVTNYTFNPADYVSDLSQNITVTYQANQQLAHTVYLDADENNAHVPSTPDGTVIQNVEIKGVTGGKIDYAFDAAHDQNYTAISKYYNVKSVDVPSTFDNDDDNDQIVYVYLTHRTEDVSNTDKEAKTTATRTINVTTPDGKTNSVKQEVNYKRTATKDLVNGHITYGQWQADGASAWEEYTPIPHKKATRR